MWTQVKLIRTVDDGRQVRTTFIEDHMAKAGLTLTDEEDVRWVVDEVYKSSTRKDPPYSVGAIRNHRKRTGDSL